MRFLCSLSCPSQVSEGDPGDGAMSDKTRDNHKQCFAHECVSECTSITELHLFACISYMERSEIGVQVN